MQTGNNGILIQQNSSALFEGALSVKVSGDTGLISVLWFLRAEN